MGIDERIVDVLKETHFATTSIYQYLLLLRGVLTPDILAFGLRRKRYCVICGPILTSSPSRLAPSLAVRVNLLAFQILLGS